MDPFDYPAAGGRGWRSKNRVYAQKPYFHSNPPSLSPPQKRSYGCRRASFNDCSPSQHVEYRKRDGPRFIIELTCAGGGSPGPESDVETLIGKCKCAPETFFVLPGDGIAGRMFFRQWTEARKSMVSLWELRLDGAHRFDPLFKSDILQPSDEVELLEDLKNLFASRVRGLLTGDVVRECRDKLDRVKVEISEVLSFLGKSNRLGKFEELLKNKKGLLSEKQLISKRIQEFESAMACILYHLEGRQPKGFNYEGVNVFKFGGDFNWSRIHGLMMRELQRLQEGLPIYSHRKDILKQISSQKITILIGETGSGKSTQLVQYLADSGVASDEAIICTQPRKIAAITLARRVTDESSMCYDSKSIIWCPAYSSIHLDDSKIIYMTDHCLLQRYMDDKNLSGISCIIIDEAHERSLNTDLLLALIKDLFFRKHDLRLVVMSATADSSKLSDYFFGCETFHILGRSFPVDIKYVPSVSQVTSGCETVAAYVYDVLRMVGEIHKTEKDGAVLAFLTSQLEVEWACENFQFPATISLPLHGKLSNEEQLRVYMNYPGKRKVIFATNVAETSLTIPGVKYVVDSGVVKESRFEPSSGMSILRVCWTSKSSANQRSGRAGRTEPGCCYRLYSESDYELMSDHQEPEICRVHLGTAVLRIFALGIKNVEDFDFIDSPSLVAIDMTIRNLIQLGAIEFRNEVWELTEEGIYLVKLGIEPRLGKLIRGCFDCHLAKEGLVLASVMANASSVFCRVGDVENKLKSDRLKLQFCHHGGDLFTLLSVYKEWESLPAEKRNKWCWENSINAKSMRRCHDTVLELEQCLQKEFFGIIPSYWTWNPHLITEHDKNMKKVIISSLVENVAMYSGYERFGYEVALTGQSVQLHPSCSLQMFSQKPKWVVYGEILSSSCEYLVCVTSFDIETLSSLCPPPPYDISKIEDGRLHVRTLTGLGSILLKRICGRFKSNVLRLVSSIQAECSDDRIGVEVDADRNEILVFSPSQYMEMAVNCVNDALVNERKWQRNECLDMCLYHGGPLGLFGAGAQIKHVELENRYMSVDVYYSSTSSIDNKELFSFIEDFSSGSICGVQKNGQDIMGKEKSCKITFLTPDAAEKAAQLDGSEFNGSVLRVSLHTLGTDRKSTSFSSVNLKANIYWPRKPSRGVAFVTCDPEDVYFMVDDFSVLQDVRSEVGLKTKDCVVLSGLDKNLSETEILNILRPTTTGRIIDIRLSRYNSVFDRLPCRACEEAIVREVSPFMPRGNAIGMFCQVQVYPPEPNGIFTKGMIIFDGRLHLEAAKALEQIQGKVLPGFLPWQKIECRPYFRSSVWCPPSVYSVIGNELESLVTRFRRRKGIECSLDRLDNGSYRVSICANATLAVAEVRKPFEDLMNGKALSDPALNPTILQNLFSRDGLLLKKSIQTDTKTFILDRHFSDIRIFGSQNRVADASSKLTQSLLNLHESKQLEIHLRGKDLPPDLMKKVVSAFGPQLEGLKEKVPNANFTLNTRRHTIIIHGDKNVKSEVEDLVFKMGCFDSPSGKLTSNSEVTCPICLCEPEDVFVLEDCLHVFCRTCLVDQCDSAIKSQDGFPIRCASDGCSSLILLTDLRSLLSRSKLKDLFRSSLGFFVMSSGGKFRFCPSPDCPSIYRAADAGSTAGEPFRCGACYVETCTRCHLEYHPYLSCEGYREFKKDPDMSLREWCRGKEHVKRCPICGYTIEKGEGCNHVECRCGKHICWNCLEVFEDSSSCYNHLRSVHQAID